MSFDDAVVESRSYMAESLQVLRFIEGLSVSLTSTATENENSLKGLWLVALYGAFERSINSLVEQSILEISSHSSPSRSCKPSLYSIFYFPMVQSVKDCGYNKVFEKSSSLFRASSGNGAIAAVENPLAEMLQNVDCSTILSILNYFGIDGYEFDAASSGRIGNLRERRNAVSHGRETPGQVGERFNVTDLRQLYAIVDKEIYRLSNEMRDYCENKKYLVRA